MSLLLAVSREGIKLSFRKGTLNRLVSGLEADIKYSVDFILRPEVQRNLEMFLNKKKQYK